MKRLPSFRKLPYERQKAMVGWFFVLPWVIGLIIFFIFPLIESIRYSFGEMVLDDIGYHIDFTGIRNYYRIFVEDSDYLRKVVSSLSNVLVQVPIIVIFSLFISILLNQKFFGRTFVRATFFLPVIIANGIIITIISGDVFSQGVMESASSSQLFETEFLRALLLESGFGESFVTGLTGIVDSMFGLIWKSGIQILIFLAALQTIPESMYEASKMEGATGWEIFWKITFPMISPMILLTLIYTIIDSFTDYSNPVMLYINSFSVNMQMSISSAMSWVYFLIVLILIAVVYVFVNKKVFYQV